MKKLDFKSVLIGFLGALTILLSINASSIKTPENNIYEFSDKGEKEVLRFNKVTGGIESVKVRDEIVTQTYDLNLITPGYLDLRNH
tara:strand:+ start:139 stop:396 length:258 start_codon:yes stop_codon:yes gene_type:complete